jgi:hypothetical protein
MLFGIKLKFWGDWMSFGVGLRRSGKRMIAGFEEPIK